MKHLIKLCLFLLASCLLLAGCGGGADITAPVQIAAAAPVPYLAPASTPINSALVNGTDAWPAGSSAAGARGKPVDGVQCATAEDFHIHAHLSILRDGKLLALPANIGLQGCTYELHTHDRSGIVHVEAAASRQFTLGQLFAVWGQALERGQVAGLSGSLQVYVNDGAGLVRHNGDPRAVEIRAHRLIYLVLGTAPAQLPDYHWPSTL